MYENNEQADESAIFDVHAAGGVIFRGAETDVELVIVHRPRYDDWTFPKGKAESGETDEQTAHREVLEETGFDCELGEELPSVTYRDHKNRSKIVRYWEMTIRSGVFEANDEVDILEWVSAAEAGERLTYDHDVDVLSAFLTLVSER
jgi:8-oxo-dGTP diphosphatase